MDFVQMLREYLEKTLAESHPEDHAFVARTDDPTECSVCGWMGLGGKPGPCGHTKRDHMVTVLQAIREGKVMVGEPMIITYRFAYRPFSWLDFLSGRYW